MLNLLLFSLPVVTFVLYSHLMLQVGLRKQAHWLADRILWLTGVAFVVVFAALLLQWPVGGQLAGGFTSVVRWLHG